MEMLDFRHVPKDLMQKLNALTPIEEHDGYFFKRDDKFELGGVRGGKARACYWLSYGAKGLVTAGSRFSPQVKILSHVAKYFGVPARCHVPSGETTDIILSAQKAGAEVIRHKCGYNTVIIRRAKDDAEKYGYTYIPFGMETWEAIRQTSKQTENIPPDTKRIVITVGSGMSLAGVVHGLTKRKLKIPILGVVVGANPARRLNTYAPINWNKRVTLVSSVFDYHDMVDTNKIGSLELNKTYEAKCVPFLKKDDLFWLVGF